MVAMNSLIHGKYSELRAWERLGMKGAARLFKLLVRSVPYGSVAVLLYLVVTPGQWSLSRFLLLLWGICEVAFFLYWKIRMAMPFLRKPNSLTEEQRRALCCRLAENADDMEDMLERWLTERPAGNFCLEYYTEWIVWMLFDKKQEEMTYSEEAQLKRLLPLLTVNVSKTSSLYQKATKYSAMRPSLDSMKMQPKPFIAHLFIKIVHTLGFWALRVLGFRPSVADGLTYWHYPGDTSEPPILYIHGIGIGFAMYMGKLIAMKRFHSQRRIFLLELPYISMDISSNILNHDETLNAIDTIFKEHSLEKVSVVGHSYGTILASWLMRERPHYLSRLTLVDPVCFCIWDSTLARNFLYSKAFSFLHELALFFVARDPLIAHTVSKELYWYESVLFPEDISVPAHIFLSTQDWVVDAATCNQYLQKRLPNHCTIELMETSHGGCLANRAYYSRIVQLI